MAEGSLQGGFALGPQECRGLAQRWGALSGVTLEIVAMQGFGYCIGDFILSTLRRRESIRGHGIKLEPYRRGNVICRLARGG